MYKFKPKFYSPDGIAGFFLKSFAPVLVCLLTTIFNLSLSSAQLPHAIVTPLYKGKGTRSDAYNYRSISCANVTGKIFDSVANNYLLLHFLSNSILSQAQFGFLSNRFTTSNLLFTNNLLHKELADDKFNSIQFICIQYKHTICRKSKHSSKNTIYDLLTRSPLKETRKVNTRQIFHNII